MKPIYNHTTITAIHERLHDLMALTLYYPLFLRTISVYYVFKLGGFGRGGPGFFGGGFGYGYGSPFFGGGYWGGGPGYYGGGGPFFPCWLCCFYPPPPPPPVYVRPPPAYVVDQNVTTSSPLLPRELTVLEFIEGDTPLKYMVVLPKDAVPGSIVRVKLGGKEFSILLPDYLDRGEKIVVIAPAPSSAIIDTPSATATAVATATPMTSVLSPREIKAIEFRHSDVPSKHTYVLPDNVVVGQVVSVTLSGMDFNVKMPESMKKGETVIIVAPAALI